MRSILDACKPRPEIVAGSFNPDVFTAQLGPIIDHYRHGSRVIDSIYTDAEQFFRDATYPTQGLKTALSEVFGRIAGDLTVPAIHRLETAFGGGKTHTLIACTHIAYKGKMLQGITDSLINPELLPEPGSVLVVGVAGDQLPVHKPVGDALVPYTLWGEIAYQLGGEDLYRRLDADVTSHAAPGITYFNEVFASCKVIIMLDELAQYAARLDAARPDGASQLAAFLMSLGIYARSHPGIAVLLTLASASDAFARQTEQLSVLIGQVRGQDVSEDEALGIGERAVRDVSSVVARDAVQITPVHATEISAVLAKRLFIAIDRDAARETAEDYMQMYHRNSTLLPDDASSENYRDRMVANYPFHPTLVDFLNQKLADAENFQGTRGVLRVLSLAVRCLWQASKDVPMIHACHLDMRSDRLVNEILGRTGSSDLLLVLNADVGGVDTGSLESGQSNAERADRRNPHPEGYPYIEYTWKTVFLHSLVGRSAGLASNLFGLTETEALLAVAFPGLTPPQVHTALEEIGESAFYLRDEQGRYYAGLEPTLNSVLALIRSSFNADEIQKVISQAAARVITGNGGLFHIEHEVSLPEHLPDNKDRPVLGVVSIAAGSVDVEAMVTTKGPNRPREQQNLIFILVPDTVAVRTENYQPSLFENENYQPSLFDSEHSKAQESRQRLETIARQARAMRLLFDRPQNYGVNPARLQQDDFRKRQAEREKALETAIASVYTSLYYPSSGGNIVRKEIRTAGGEGGAPFIELIKESLIRDGELLTDKNTTQSDLQNLSRLFFEQADAISLAKLRDSFACVRSWPVLSSAGILEQIIRAGVDKGAWCLFRMGAQENVRPDEFYDREHPVPLGANLAIGDYSLVTVQGARQRGWGETGGVDPARVRDIVINAVAHNGTATVQQLAESVSEQIGPVPSQDLEESVVSLLRNERFYVYHGEPDQAQRPELIHGAGAALYAPQPGDVLITPAKAAALGWITARQNTFSLAGRDGAEHLLPLLPRLGSLYARGAKSTIRTLDITELGLLDGGMLRLQISDATPATMKRLGELFEVLAGVVQRVDQAEVYLTIDEPDDSCILIQELKKLSTKSEA